MTISNNLMGMCRTYIERVAAASRFGIRSFAKRSGADCECKSRHMLIFTLLMLAGCATPARYSSLPPPNLPLTIEKLTAPQMLGPTFQFASRTNVIPWQYPTNTLQPINAYCWQLQTKTNVNDPWQDAPGPCLTDPMMVYATNQVRYFRLIGVIAQ